MPCQLPDVTHVTLAMTAAAFHRVDRPLSIEDIALPLAGRAELVLRMHQWRREGGGPVFGREFSARASTAARMAAWRTHHGFAEQSRHAAS